MKDLVIYGNKNFARILKYYVDKDDIHKRKVVAFTVSNDCIQEKLFCNLPVIPFEDLVNHFSPDQYEILLAVGNSKMNQIREHIFYECKGKGYTVASYHHSSCHIDSEMIGEGNIFLDNCLIAPFSKIGYGNLFWDNVIIGHDAIVGNFNTLSGHADTCGYAKIGNNCYLGKHSLINDFVSVADYTYVGAKAYVKTNTDDYDVIVAPESKRIQRFKSTAFVHIIESMETVNRT